MEQQVSQTSEEHDLLWDHARSVSKARAAVHSSLEMSGERAVVSCLSSPPLSFAAVAVFVLLLHP